MGFSGALQFTNIATDRVLDSLFRNPTIIWNEYIIKILISSLHYICYQEHCLTNWNANLCWEFNILLCLIDPDQYQSQLWPPTWDLLFCSSFSFQRDDMQVKNWLFSWCVLRAWFALNSPSQTDRGETRQDNNFVIIWQSNLSYRDIST